MYPSKSPPALVDLTQEPEYLIGTLRIQARACAVSVGNTELRIEPRQMQVLVALAQAAPDVVTRADLSVKAWGNSIVGEDALNRCITRLRRALLELGQPAQIETVPKLGYRLYPSQVAHSTLDPINDDAPLSANHAQLGAESEQLDAAQTRDTTVEAAVMPAIVQPSGLQSKQSVLTLKHIGALAAALVLTVVTTISWSVLKWRASSRADLAQTPSHSNQSAYAVGEVHRVVPSSKVQRAQRLSPDGQSLAFVREMGTTLPVSLVVRGLSGDIERELISKPGIHGLAWSPDGNAIAYAQALPEQSCQLWVVETRSGTERQVGACKHAADTLIAWSANGRELYFQDQQSLHGPSHIAALMLNTRSVSILTTPHIGSGDMFPTPSRDGKTLAFLREDAWLSGHVFLLDLHTSEQKQLTQSASDIYGIAWEPNGRGLLVSSNWGGDIGLWRLSLDGAAQRLGGAGVNYGFLASSRASARLSFEVQQKRSRMVLLQGQNSSTSLAPYAHAPSDTDDNSEATTDVSMPDLSPANAVRDADPDFDPIHNQLVFVSWRSGRPQLWLHQSSGAPRQLSSGAFDYLGGPRWSPDARQIVAARAQNAQQDLVLFDINQGREMQLTQDAALDYAPQWSPDGKSVLFVSDRGGALGLWRIDIATRAIELVMPNAQAGAIDVLGNLVFQATDKPGLWLKRADSKSGAAATQIAELSHHRHIHMRHHQGDFFVLEVRPDNSSALHRFDLEQGMRTVGVWTEGLDHKSQFTFTRDGDVLTIACVKSTELFWAEPTDAAMVGLPGVDLVSRLP
jgi:Tol biopolymer transport system component/DNA-binding winged helix-turn-helix (wHTH) protein